VVLYIPIEKYNYKVIKECDIILHHSEAQKYDLYGMDKTKDAH